MAYDSKNKTIEKQVTESQSYTAKITGDRKKSCETEYRFYGSDWENFAVLLAKRGIEQHNLNFFIGAKLLYHTQTVIFSNAFACDVWKEKHAVAFPKWTFRCEPKRIKLANASKDDDTLSYQNNNRDAQDLWEEHFVAPNYEEAA